MTIAVPGVMIRQTSVVLTVLSLGAVGCTDEDSSPIVESIEVPKCASTPELEELTVMVSGSVVDFVTRQPLAGVTVDIAKAWESEARFPDASCSLATTVTGENGRFGPLAVKAGPEVGFFDSRYLVFLVQGSGVAPVASDIRTTCGSTCTVADHVIAAPSTELAASWRVELDDGGMDRARTRGLVAFAFREATGAAAGGVTAMREVLFELEPLERGDEVRYLEADRATVAPVSQSTTLESGVALIGIEPNHRGDRAIGGKRGNAFWTRTGCLIGDGWIFLEDNQVGGEL